MSRHRGITLIEVIVVLGVIALLVALLVPAIQAARGAALRMSCASNLRQIAQAFALYESTFRVYPMGAFRYHILPYLDQQALYDLPLSLPTANQSGEFFVPLNPYCPPIYRCPADPAPFGYGGITSANYLGNAGTWRLAYGYNGILTFPGDEHPILTSKWVAPRDVLDGLSNTALVSEVLRADGTNHRLRTAWNTPEGYGDLDEFTQTCESIPPIPPDYGWQGDPNYIGRPWHSGGWGVMAYCHGSPPNRPSCDNRIFVPDGLWTAASLHGGGVNVAFADGHVVFVSDSIDRQVWRDFGSRAGTNVGP